MILSRQTAPSIYFVVGAELLYILQCALHAVRYHLLINSELAGSMQKLLTSKPYRPCKLQMRFCLEIRDEYVFKDIRQHLEVFYTADRRFLKSIHT